MVANKGGKNMFNFRIIKISKDIDIIDKRQVTSEDRLSPIELLDYTELENSLYFFERQERRKRKEESRKETKIHSILVSLQTACGIL